MTIDLTPAAMLGGGARRVSLLEIASKGASSPAPSGGGFFVSIADPYPRGLSVEYKAHSAPNFSGLVRNGRD
jgi:hypothetical protein